MSVKAMTAAWKVQCDASSKLILLALADHANDETFECWPSLTHLASKTGLSRRSVMRCLNSLESERLIGREQRGKQVTKYRLNVANWGHSDPRDTVTLGTDCHQPRDTVSPGLGTQCHQPRDTVTPEPSGNRQGEPSGNHRVRSPRTANRFDEFWQAWPPTRKRDKKKAREAWKRKGLDSMADEIIADVQRRQREDQQWLSGYVPLPTTYINGERWEDEYAAQGGQGSNSNDPFTGAV